MLDAWGVESAEQLARCNLLRLRLWLGDLFAARQVTSPLMVRGAQCATHMTSTGKAVTQQDNLSTSWSSEVVASACSSAGWGLAPTYICAHVVRHIRCKAITYATSVGNDFSPWLGMCLLQDRCTPNANSSGGWWALSISNRGRRGAPSAWSLGLWSYLLYRGSWQPAYETNKQTNK